MQLLGGSLRTRHELVTCLNILFHIQFMPFIKTRQCFVPSSHRSNCSLCRANCNQVILHIVNNCGNLSVSSLMMLVCLTVCWSCCSAPSPWIGTIQYCQYLQLPIPLLVLRTQTSVRSLYSPYRQGSSRLRVAPVWSTGLVSCLYLACWLSVDKADKSRWSYFQPL